MKRVISLLMVIALLLSLVTIMAFGLSSNGFTYTVEDGEATVTAYSNSGSAITIPETLGGVPVVAIGDYAFADRAEKSSDISSLSLPSTLKRIGAGAFDINSTAASLSIPANVESIGNRAFHCWIQLDSVIFEGNKLTKIGMWAFKNCHCLNNLNFPASLEEIEEGAFSYCTSLRSVTIPASVKSVEREAFLGCTSLSSVTFEGKNTGIGDNAFDLTASSGASRTLKVYGYNDSSAQRFASAEKFSFEALAEPSPDDPTPEDPTPDDPGTGSGDYYVRITYAITGSNSIKEKYAGFNQGNNDSAGFSLLYKEINGTASDYKEVSWDLGSKMTAGTGSFTATCSISGFPYMLYGYLDDNRAGSSAAYNISKLEVGSSSQDLKTVWSGKISLASQFNAFGVSLDWDNNAKADYFTTPDSNNKVQSSSGAWEKPYAKVINADYQNKTVSLSKEEQSVSNPFTYSALDQYGVAMNTSLCKDVKLSASSGADASLISIQYKNGSGTVACDKALHLSAPDKNDQNISLDFTWQGKDSTKTDSASFVLMDEEYTISWFNEEGGLFAQTQEYYGQMPYMDVSDKAADDDYHYQNGRWAETIVAATEDASYHAVYDAVEHTYVLDEESSHAGDCVNPGLSVYVCSACGHSKQVTEQGGTSHEYVISSVVEATCTQGGYTTYTCEKCGHTLTTDYVDALGHDFSIEDPCEDAIRSTGSWNTNGTFYYSCARCGKIDYRGSYFEYVTGGVCGTVDMSNQFKPVTVILLKDGEEFDSVVLKPNSNGSFMFCELDPGNIYTLIFEGESTTIAEIDAIDLADGAKMDLNMNENSDISTISVTLGDINADSLVDVKDISEILAAGVYGSGNTAADVNNSGAVDIVDIGIVLSSDNYGSSAKYMKA
ncbi:MAG: leucine-rich repeat protein [Clostridia bacterium]|nr:leucine-rich repeat protein [Clostridia bacterium]